MFTVPYYCNGLFKLYVLMLIHCTLQLNINVAPMADMCK